MRTTRLIGGLVAGMALVAPIAPAAQDVRNVPVQDRARPDYDPLGIRARAFLVYPRLDIGTTYDDNIFATEDDEEDDLIFTVRPSVSAESQWSRHQLNLSAFGDFGFFASNSDSNYQDFGAELGGRLDVTRDSRTSARLGISRLHEDRDAPDETGDEDITQYWRFDTQLSHRHNFARFFLQPRVQFIRLDFDDAGDIDNDDRDRNRFRAGLRSGFAVSPRINLFGEFSGDLVRYDDTPGLDRDSQGLDARIGTEVDLTGVVFGEVSLGYTRRSYDDDDLDTVSGFAGDAAITWNITPLTSIVFDAEAGIDETTVVFQGDEASGNLYSALGVDVTHELRRNVLLNANARYQRDDFDGTARTDDTYRLGAGVTYLINRRFSVNANYRFSTRDSDAGNEEFTRNIFRVGLAAKL